MFQINNWIIEWVSEWMDGCYVPSAMLAIYLISLRKFITGTGRQYCSALPAKGWSV